jgi:hypothetical protein
LPRKVPVAAAPKSSPKTLDFMAWGAHAPTRVAVGALADRFFRVKCGFYKFIHAQYKS